MNFIQIAILAVVQGMAELLPVSSSAHVIVAEKLMGVDPTSPEMTFLLVMLHTGTMGAVLIYFWKRWMKLFSSVERMTLIKNLFLATVATGVVGYGLKHLIEKYFLGGSTGESGEIEQLFGNLVLVSIALFCVGVLILVAGKKSEGGPAQQKPQEQLVPNNAILIGVVQGLCLPFRGFSRSGATISTGMMLGVSRQLAEEFSFALAVILTPPVILRELMRLMKADALHSSTVTALVLPGLVGMVFSFFAGLVALRWVSSWIDQGKWSWFGYYCIVASGVVFLIHSISG